jgi:hypothetical protein
MRFESKRGPKIKKLKKNMFCKLKSFFFYCYFFINSFLCTSKMISKT